MFHSLPIVIPYTQRHIIVYTHGMMAVKLHCHYSSMDGKYARRQQGELA